MKACIFVAAGDISDRYFEALKNLSPRPFVIAIDGGYEYLKKKNFKPDMAVGDFDSLGYIPEDVETELHPVRKDKTDMLLAVDTAILQGFDTAFVLGAFGGTRLDHTYSNLQNLFYESDKFRMILLDDRALCFSAENEIVTIADRALEISSEVPGSAPYIHVPENLVELAAVRESYLSIFALEKARVTIRGCSYDGEGLELTNRFTLGTSNYITEKEATIHAKGPVLIMFSGRHPENAM